MDLNIKINQRDYGGKKFRPKTHMDFEESNNLLLCITSWGAHDIGEKVADSIKSFISMADEDTEMTVPFARKENLQQRGNVLRMAVIMASEKIFNEHNKEEYTSGFEIFAAVQEGPQWIYVSCGQPSLIINRSNIGVVPINQAVDMNVLTLRASIHDPLPNHLLGLGQHPPIQYGNIRLRPDDQLALISRTYLPNSFFKLERDEFSLEKISRVLAEDNQEIPFWLGLVNVDQG